jgi:murein L,D-transpeptidase YafK
VEKAARRLTLLDHGRPLKTYPVSLGWSPRGPKQQEGDYRTPEGIYTIDWHKPNSICHRALHVSYPDAADQAQATARGVSPGGSIMVHGLPNGFGWMGAFHRIFNYTAGCVAVTDVQIDEIYGAVADGTPIEIRP